MVLRHPYIRTGDAGQALHLDVDGDSWRAEVIDGTPDQAPTYSSTELGEGKKRKGKSARCLFCRHVHSLEAVKAKGFNGEYRDELLVAADTQGETKKVFRMLRPDERAAVAKVDLSGFPAFALYSAGPDERIAVGNVHTVMACGYGYRTFGSLMCDRQTLQFVETARAIRVCYGEMRGAGLSPEYSKALAAFAGAILVRKLKYSTRGANLQPFGKSDGSGSNRIAVRHIFASEASVAFQFDFFQGVRDALCARTLTGTRP